MVDSVSALVDAFGLVSDSGSWTEIVGDSLLGCTGELAVEVSFVVESTGEVPMMERASVGAQRVWGGEVEFGKVSVTKECSAGRAMTTSMTRGIREPWERLEIDTLGRCDRGAWDDLICCVEDVAACGIETGDLTSRCIFLG